MSKLSLHSGCQFGICSSVMTLVIPTVYSVAQSFILQTKKMKMGLQKAVSITINSISAQSGSALKKKVTTLLTLLSGGSVSIGNDSVTTHGIPEAIMFCKNLTAKKLVVSLYNLQAYHDIAYLCFHICSTIGFYRVHGYFELGFEIYLADTLLHRVTLIYSHRFFIQFSGYTECLVTCTLYVKSDNFNFKT